MLPVLLGVTGGGASGQGAAKPKLVVFITVDAMRPDHLSRFESQLTGGLGRIYRGGAVFTSSTLTCRSFSTGRRSRPIAILNLPEWLIWRRRWPQLQV